MDFVEKNREWKLEINYLLAQLNFMVITGLLRECFYGNYNNNLINS